MSVLVTALLNPRKLSDNSQDQSLNNLTRLSRTGALVFGLLPHIDFR